VAGAAYSPDGLRIVTASFDKSARVWDAGSGQQLLMLRGHTDRLESAAFSGDGQRIITAALDKTARVWSAGNPLRSLPGHTDELSTAQFSPDGQRILTASADKTARIWDGTSGKSLLILSGHDDQVRAAAFSPDGRRVGTAAWDGTARLWDAATGNQLLVLRGHTERLEGVGFSSDGRRLVTAARDATVRVWDAASGAQLRVLTAGTEHVPRPEFSPDGRRIVGGASNGTVHVWDADSGKELLVLRGHTDFVNTASWSPDGRLLVTASNDATARVWDSESGRQLLLLSGHTDRVRAASFSRNGRHIVTASWDKTARIWDAVNGALLRVLNGDTHRLESAAFSPDGRRVVTASDDITARVWEADAGSLDMQADWAEAAQFESLTSAERFRLGLSPRTQLRLWRADETQCDELAAAPYDPLRRAPGVTVDQISKDEASRACAQALSGSGGSGRLLYQHGRTLTARGDFAGARRDFEQALATGYPVAAIDLAGLLSQPSAGMLDTRRAISLYEQAWGEGVAVAAFELGRMYQNGVRRGPDTDAYVLDPKESLAWDWYQKGAAKDEPNSLARFAEKEARAALAAENAESTNAHLLEAFSHYAAASERAQLEDWPDDAWRDWRYQRASIAHLLAGKGMMEDVAVRYDAVRRKYAPQQTVWKRFRSPSASTDWRAR
jgi:WD40 repeat protein/TPR repeat protein